MEMEHKYVYYIINISENFKQISKTYNFQEIILWIRDFCDR